MATPATTTPPPAATAPAEFRSRDAHGLQRLVARASGWALVVLLLVGAAIPSLIFKSGIGFAAVVALIAVNMATTRHAFTWFRLDRFRLLTVGFVLAGTIGLALSLLNAYPDLPLLPLRQDYVLRHGYFVVLWLPVLIGGVSFWDRNLGWTIVLSRRGGLLVLAILAVGDLVTADLFGDPRTANWSGYVYYLEKAAFAFIFTVTYVFYVVYGGRRWLAAGLITTYFVLSRALALGIMFNATTGAFIYIALMLATLPIGSLRLRSVLVVTILTAALAVIVYGLLFPDQFAFDRNTYWRLVSWRQNLASLWDSYLIGVGFGTPYHPLSMENLVVAGTLDDLREPTFPGEAQYFRAQHSSFINVFYRLGIPGGLAFATLNFLLVHRLGAAIRLARSPATQRTIFAALVLFVIAIFQIMVHVGLETPRFFVVYILSMALALSVLEQSPECCMRSSV